ncbi:hypothetical protein B1B05_11505 [Domibacillus enclensis]|uniref:Uncharacterized protein n=1 Tax=Domibacillus enclensis TaxID=1017273 RepID=A0ABX4E7I2_9BACI|nr:hypothetical protein B1B05_11505 [Domibacillus enclensis]
MFNILPKKHWWYNKEKGVVSILSLLNQSNNITAAIIIGLFFVTIVLFTTFLLARKYKSSSPSIGAGFLVFLLSSILVLEITTRFLFFKENTYYNYGLGGSYLRLISSFGLSFFAGFFLTNFFYARKSHRN